jgi:hypothetical protein
MPAGICDPLLAASGGSSPQTYAHILVNDGRDAARGRVASAPVVDSADPIADGERSRLAGGPQVAVVEADFIVAQNNSAPAFPRPQMGASGAPRASRWPRLRPPRRQDGHTASMLKTIPPRVIPKTIPLRVMPQRRPPRVISQPTPLRVVGVGENCRQRVRRAEDRHVARCLTGGRSPRVEAGLLTRRRRSTRCGGDRHGSNRGCKQRYVVVQPRSHDQLANSRCCDRSACSGPTDLGPSPCHARSRCAGPCPVGIHAARGDALRTCRRRRWSTSAPTEAHRSATPR